MVMKKGITTSIILGSLSFLSPSVVSASTSAGKSLKWVDEILENLISAPLTLEEFVVKVLNWLIGASVILCVIMLIVSGFLYMTSGGNEDKVGKATKTLVNAIIGLVISFVAVMLVNFILKKFLNQL
jgi:predicted permease